MINNYRSISIAIISFLQFGYCVIPDQQKNTIIDFAKQLSIYIDTASNMEKKALKKITKNWPSERGLIIIDNNIVYEKDSKGNLSTNIQNQILNSKKSYLSTNFYHDTIYDTTIGAQMLIDFNLYESPKNVKKIKIFSFDVQVNLLDFSECQRLFNFKNKIIGDLEKIDYAKSFVDKFVKDSLFLVAKDAYKLYKKSIEWYQMDYKKISVSDTNLSWIDDSINACYRKNEIKNRTEMLMADSLVKLRNEIEKQRTKLLSDALVITGEVTNRDGNVVSVYGGAVPFNSAGTDNGPIGMAIATAANALTNELSSYSNETSETESVKGAIVHSDENLVIMDYKNDYKIYGNASIGGKFSAGPYIYSHQGKGTNALGGTVVIYYYKNHPQKTNADALKEKASKLNKERISIINAIIDKECSKLTKADSAFFKGDFITKGLDN